MKFVFALLSYPLRVVWATLRGLVWPWRSGVELIHHRTDAPEWLEEFKKEHEDLLRGYVPLAWAPDGHSQSCMAVLYCGDSSVSYERELMEMEDRELVALDWARVDGEAPPSDGPICLLLPGLSSNAEDMRNAAGVAVRHGLQAVVYNKRGHAHGQPLTGPKLLAFGDTSDLRQIVVALKKRSPSVPLVGIGLSAGIGLLASYLQDFPHDSLLDAFVGISPGYDTKKLFCTGGGTLPWPYDRILLSSQKKLVQKSCTTFAGHIDVDAVQKCTTLNEFTSLVDLPTYGLSSLDQYWELNNPLRGDFDNTRVPVMCINARDDPVVLESMLPLKMFREDWPTGLLVLSETGGHCGFLEGHGGQHWDYRLAVAFLKFVTRVVRRGREGGT